MFRIADLPHSPGVVYYYLLLRRETRIPGVIPFTFRIGIWDLFVHRGQKSYTPTSFGKLWTTLGVMLPRDSELQDKTISSNRFYQRCLAVPEIEWQLVCQF